MDSAINTWKGLSSEIGKAVMLTAQDAPVCVPLVQLVIADPARYDILPGAKSNFPGRATWVRQRAPATVRLKFFG